MAGEYSTGPMEWAGEGVDSEGVDHRYGFRISIFRPACEAAVINETEAVAVANGSGFPAPDSMASVGGEGYCNYSVKFGCRRRTR